MAVFWRITMSSDWHDQWEREQQEQEWLEHEAFLKADKEYAIWSEHISKQARKEIDEQHS